MKTRTVPLEGEVSVGVDADAAPVGSVSRRVRARLPPQPILQTNKRGELKLSCVCFDADDEVFRCCSFAHGVRGRRMQGGFRTD